jgi:lipopolysaccharide/colanic/teichoic acid biosynthesis glycosyltransferase
MTIKRKILSKLMAIIIDSGLILMSFIAAFWLRIGSFNSNDFPFEPYLNLAFYITPFFILLFAWGGLYGFKEKHFLEKFRIISLSCLTGSMAFVLFFFFSREIFFSRAIVAMIFAISTISVFICHQFVLLIKKNHWNNGKNAIRVLIIGANNTAERVIKSLQGTEYYPVCILAPYGSKQKEICGIKVAGKLNVLEKTIKKYEIDEIFQCDALEQSLNLITFAEGHFLGYKISPEILGAFHKNIQPEIISCSSFLALNLSPLFGWGQFIKRIFDIVGALIVLPFLVLIYVFTLGSVFTCEKRARGFRETFYMWRFKNYKFLKKSFLIDFPAFFNVLKGDMSIIGPRPSRVKERDNYPEHFKRRLILKPGVLGLWQLEKLKGQADDLDLMLEKDLSYIHSWSIRNDFKIFFKSLLLIIKRL